ncbi:hypothetical protein PENTCL1PPCAC_13801, partial [Pristionchus entomophagus]
RMRPRSLLLLLLPALAAAYNIAVFVPYMANSQVIFNARVAETLANAGHNVSLFVIALYNHKFQEVKVAENVKYHFVNISAGMDGEAMMHLHSKIVFESIPFWDKRQRTVIRQMLSLVDTCENLITKPGLIDYIRDQKFDIAFAYMHSFCPLGLIHAAGIPTWIWMNTGTLSDVVADVSGVPLPPSYCTPTMMDASDSLSFFERVQSFVGWGVTRLVWPRVFANRETAMYRKHLGSSFPDLIDLAKRTPLIMANTNELYDFPRPTLSKIVNIGGLGMKKVDSKPLEEMYANLTESARDGIVVMSFGSIAPMFLMPLKWKQSFAYAFSQFPHIQFFIRYEKDDLMGILPDNVHISKWLPQKDLLHHPKARALITHGGYNSLQDAIHAGVPIVTIPLFFDQPRNGHRAEKLGFGVNLKKERVSKETVTAALRSVLTDANMLKSARRVRAMAEKKPVAPEDLLVRWTEFVAEFQTLDHMTPPGAHLHFIQYHSLDVMLFLAVLAAFAGWLSLKAIRSFGQQSTRNSPIKEKTS